MKITLAVVCLGLASACSYEVADPSESNAGVISEPLVGTVVVDDYFGVPFTGCSAVALSDYWVLTAAHCSPSPYLRETTLRFLHDDGSVENIPISHAYVHPYADVALLRLSSRHGRQWLYTNNLYEGSTGSLMGTQLKCFGWGPDGAGGNYGILRESIPVKVVATGTIAPDGIHNVSRFSIGRVSGSGDVVFGGDSGGPCFVQIGSQWRVAGVLGGPEYTSTESFRDWVWMTMVAELAPTEVTAATDSWLEGKTVVWDAESDMPNAVSLFLPDNSISSLAIGSMAKAQLYENASFGGLTTSLAGPQDWNDLGQGMGFNDITSSAKVSDNVCGTSPSSYEVFVYEHSNYGGNCERLTGLSLDDTSTLVIGDGISSIKVGANAKVSLYDNRGFAGGRLVLTSNQADLTSMGWNDRARSLRVNQSNCDPPLANEVVLWTDDYFRGNCQFLGIGEYSNGTQLGVGGNAASSVQVGPSVRLGLYKSTNFAGAAYYLHADAARFRGLGGGSGIAGGHFNDAVNSVRVRRQTACGSPGTNQAVVWEDANYQGRCVVLNVGNHQKTFVSEFDFANDAASSIKLGANVKATLYENDFFAGASITVLNSVPDLGGINWNDSVSSLKIILK